MKINFSIDDKALNPARLAFRLSGAVERARQQAEDRAVRRERTELEDNS